MTPVSFRLPYGYENRWFRLDCRAGDGVTALVDKRSGKNLLGPGAAPFFHAAVRGHAAAPGPNRRL